MNQKKVKNIRKALKEAGFNWRDRDYTIRGASMFSTGTFFLKQNCGRQVYKGTKLLQKQRA